MRAAESIRPASRPQRVEEEPTTLLVPQAESLSKLIGRECYLEDVARNLSFLVRDLHPSRVGALQACCSDESERECSEIFQRRFAEHFLPHLKFAACSPFRTVNMGARYEWGSIRLAEAHFAERKRSSTTLIVVKLNSHVSVTGSGQNQQFGMMARYQEDSPFCGALHLLLEGGRQPCLDDLAEDFRSEGKDRLECLLDPDRVDPALRKLFAAIVNARLQARKCTIDIQDYDDSCPTLYLVLPCVTLNRPGRDSEIVCGLYIADRKGKRPLVTYQGLGDDPAAYRLGRQLDRIFVESDGSSRAREARDHRQLILSRFDAPLGCALQHEQRLEQIRAEMPLQKYHLQPYAGVLLKSLLGLLMLDLPPIPAVLLLFGEGLIDVHYLHRIQRLAQRSNGDAEARSMLAEVQQKAESLPPKRVRRVLERLLHEYGRAKSRQGRQAEQSADRDRE